MRKGLYMNNVLNVCAVYKGNSHFYRKGAVAFIFILVIFMAGLDFSVWAAEEKVDLDRIVVTASRLAQMDYHLTSDVSVITSEDIETSSAHNVAGLLQERMGLNVYDKSSAKTSMVDIRGFNDTAAMNVLVLVNGRKVNSIDLSGADYLQVPLETIERIEVVRGAASVLYGDNAVGGVVNIITKEGKGPLKVRLGSEYGSFDQRRADTEMSGSRNDFSYYLYSSYADAQGYRSNSDVLSKDYDGRLGWILTDLLKAELMTSWHEDDYGLPGGLNDTELQTLGRRGSADDQDFGSTKDRNVHLRLDTTPWPEDLDLGHLVFDLSYRNRDTYAEFAAYDFGTKRMIDTLGLNSKYTFNQEVLGHEVSFVTGTDFYDVDNDIWGSGSNSDDMTISKKEFGAYVFGEFEVLTDSFVNAGTRYQRADYTFDQRNGTPNYEKQTADEQVSMLGFKHEYAPGSNIYASVEQTFRFLATDEWYDTWTGLNTGLKQQQGIQYEVGLKHNFKDTTTFGITPYWIEIDDEIFFDPKSGGGYGSNSNYDTTRRLGIELEQRTDLLKIVEVDALSRWEFFTSYTYQEPEFLNGPNDGKQIPMVPNNQWTAGTSCGFWDVYDISATARYAGSRFAINDTLNETAKVKDNIVLDTKLAYRRTNYQVYLAVDNVLNEKYFSYVSKAVGSLTKDYYPASERTFRVGASVTF